MTETLAQNLKEIELPRSVRNVLRFLADLGIALEPTGVEPLGSRFGELAASVFERHLGVTEMLPSLMARHEIQALDIRRFALWIRQILPEEEPETAAEYHRRSTPRYVVEDDVEARPLRRPQKSVDVEKEEERIAEPSRRAVQGRRDPGESVSVGESLGMVALASEVARPLWPAAVGLSSFAFGVAVSRRWEPSPSVIGVPEVRHSVPTSYESGIELPSRPLFRGPEVTIEQRSIVDLPAPEIYVTSQQGPMERMVGVEKVRVSASEPSKMLTRPVKPLRGLDPLPSNPLLAQLTLIAPPIRTTGVGVNAKSTTVAFDLPLLRKGAEPLTPARLQALREILPPGIQALYPAIPTAALGLSAVNIPLAAESISLFVRKGYGREEPAWAESLAAHSFSTPPMTVLQGHVLDGPPPLPGAKAPVLPLDKPFEPAVSLIPLEQRDAEGPKRQEPTTFGLDEPLPKHGGILDVFGLPVQLAKNPEEPHDLPHRHAARADLRTVPTPLVRPTLFQETQRKVLPHFHTIAATPFAPKTQAKPAETTLTNPPSVKPMAPVLPIKKETPRPVADPVFQPESLRPEHAITPKPAVPVAARPSPPPKPLVSTKPVAPETLSRENGPKIPAPVTVAPPFPAPVTARQGPKTDVGSQPLRTPALATPTGSTVEPLRSVVNAVVKVEPAPINVLPTAPAFKPVTATTTSASTTGRPAMPLAEKKPEPREEAAMAVQASEGEPMAAAGGRSATQASTNAAGSSGSKDAEIGLLANEVWSLLKRRLAFEAQRAGRG